MSLRLGGLLALALAVAVAAQSATVQVNGGALHVKAPAFHFINGTVLDQLRDGRSVRLAIAVTLFARPGVERLAQREGHFVLSYDLWEERFAVTESGTPSRSISHLSAAGAEAWCLEQLAIPMNGATIAPTTPLWVRLESVVARDEDRGADDGYTLQGLIDRLSRRSRAERRAILELGPLRLSN